MEPDLSRQTFLSLRRYNEIVIQLLDWMKTHKNEPLSIVSELDREIQQLKDIFPNEDASSFLWSSNPFAFFLYYATHSHWDIIKLTDSAKLLSYLEVFQENLNFVSSDDFYAILTNNSLNDETRSISRTLPLYIYTRAPDAWFVRLSDALELLLNSIPIKISSTKNKCIDAFSRLASNHIIIEAFSYLHVTPSAIEELFSHISTNSFYAYFPSELHGLTCVGDYVFVNKDFKHPAEMHQAATLVALLRESANLSQRFKRGERSYFENTPKIDPLTGTEYNEIGSFLEIKIFGEKLEFLNNESASFIMNPENWELDIDEFKREFKIKDIEGKKAGWMEVQIGKSSRLGSGIRLGRCGMERKIRQRNLVL